MLPCLAYEPYPTVADFQTGWRWWRDADQASRTHFVNTRLHLARTFKLGTHCTTLCHSTGSTGTLKRYRWGPCYEALYSWFLHDLVRVGSRLGRVVSLSLLGTRNESLIAVHDTPWHPVVDRWLKVAIGPEPLTSLSALLAGHDVIMAPGHYEILDLYTGFGGHLDPACLVLSTAEAITPYLYSSAARYGFEVRDWMRCWDGGASFFTCQYGSHHLVDMVAAVSVDDGKLISSDLFNLAQPFLHYHNGDRVSLRVGGRCQCGFDILDISFANKQDGLYFISPTGQVVNYIRLCFLMARAAAEAGLPEEFDLLCFSYSLTQSVLELGYLRYDMWHGSGDRRVALEERARTYGKDLGFTTVVVTAQVQSAERKFKRLTNLDLG